MKPRLRILRARVRVIITALPVLATIAIRNCRTRRGRRALARFGAELIAVVAICKAIDLLPPSPRVSVYSIAFGLSVGVAVSSLSKRLWKPSR